jgi:hypothetical protein
MVFAQRREADMNTRSTTFTLMALPHGWVSFMPFIEDIVQLADRIQQPKPRLSLRPQQ